MKRPEYVAAVTGIYRKALDTHMVTRDMEKTLLDAFNRQGFTQGYYDGALGGEMFGVREDTRENAAFFKELRQTYETGETPLVPIRFQAVVRPGLTQLTVIDPQNRVCTAQGPAPEMARVAELTKEVLIARLTKTGGTPYRCVEAAVEIEPGLSLSASAINGLRRDVLNQLTALRARRDVPALGRPERIPNYRTPQEPPAYNIQVTTKDQITGRLLKMQPNLLYVPLHLLTEDAAFTRDLVKKVRVCPVLPRVVHDGELARLKEQLRSLRALGIREALVGNLGLLLPVRECGMHPRGDFGLNIYNSAALQSIREMELRSQCLSFEMTLPQIRDAKKGLPCEILAYGRLPLMITENCLIRGRTGQCTCHLGSAKLVDKTGSEFPIIRDGNTCRSVLLNGKKLYWLDRQEDLARLGLWAVRLYFTTENPQEVDRVLSACRSGEAMDPGACTRGLYLRGLQ